MPRLLAPGLVVLLALVAVACAPSGSGSAHAPAALPPPEIDITATPREGPRKAVLAGGCFWCTEAVFYGRLLRVFFAVAHDPTQLDRQGPDSGRQYRSAIFYASEDERQVAEAYIRQLTEAKAFDRPIVTTLEKLERFYPAEAYHQDFVAQHPTHPYVVRWALPKLEKARKMQAGG